MLNSIMLPKAKPATPSCRYSRRRAAGMRPAAALGADRRARSRATPGAPRSRAAWSPERRTRSRTDRRTRSTSARTTPGSNRQSCSSSQTHDAQWMAGMANVTSRAHAVVEVDRGARRRPDRRARRTDRGRGRRRSSATRRTARPRRRSRAARARRAGRRRPRSRGSRTCRGGGHRARVARVAAMAAGCRRGGDRGVRVGRCRGEHGAARYGTRSPITRPTSVPPGLRGPRARPAPATPRRSRRPCLRPWRRSGRRARR